MYSPWQACTCSASNQLDECGHGHDDFYHRFCASLASMNNGKRKEGKSLDKLVIMT